MWLKIIRGKYFAESRRFGAGLLSLKGGISVEFIKFRKYTYKRICEKGYFMFIYHDLIFGRVMHPKSRRRLSCAFFAKYLPLFWAAGCWTNCLQFVVKTCTEHKFRQSGAVKKVKVVIKKQ